MRRRQQVHVRRRVEGRPLPDRWDDTRWKSNLAQDFDEIVEMFKEGEFYPPAFFLL